jgi:hypothetical protein|tara:strand:- start:865 stop:1155 length:291 start_codon:yes stop_codon:yes gene_type:complete
MKYLIFNTKEASLERSAQEAQARGCSGGTKYWWSTRETKVGKWALCIDDPYPRPTDEVITVEGHEVTIPNTSLAGLTPAEISNLKDSVVWPNPPTP